MSGNRHRHSTQQMGTIMAIRNESWVILLGDEDNGSALALSIFDSEDAARIALGEEIAAEQITGTWEIVELSPETLPQYVRQNVWMNNATDDDDTAGILTQYLSAQYGSSGEYLDPDDVETAIYNWGEISHGSHSDAESWAEEFIADVYGDLVPRDHPLAGYVTFDYSGFVEALESEGWLFISDPNTSECHVFDGNV